MDRVRSLWLDDAIWVRLKAEADERGTSVSALVELIAQAALDPQGRSGRSFGAFLRQRDIVRIQHGLVKSVVGILFLATAFFLIP